LIKELTRNNFKDVEFSDPHINSFISTRIFKYNKKGIKLSPKILKKFDIVVLMTDHDKFNYKMIYKNSRVIIDCRGRYSVDHKVYRA
jgi:UDP-N-acetyl-D-glucosamine dehydrogenase